jgi:hypothetical protein
MGDDVAQRATTWVEAAGKATALLLATIYGAGFLIVSIHHAKYGIVDFSPVKPRVFLAGAIFVFLVAVAALAAFRNFGFRNFTRAAYPLLDDPIARHEKRRPYAIAIRIILFYIPSRYVPFAFGFLFNFRSSAFSWSEVVAATLVVFWIILTFQHRKLRDFEQHPKMFLLVTFLLVFADFLSGLLYIERARFWTGCWFYLVGLGVMYLLSFKMDEFKRIEVETQLLPLIATALLVYSATVYDSMRPEYGGGQPVNVSVHFAQPNPVFGSSSAELRLVDETETGYYVIRKPEEKRAYFLPRGTVALIEFIQAPQP